MKDKELELKVEETEASHTLGGRLAYINRGVEKWTVSSLQDQFLKILAIYNNRRVRLDKSGLSYFFL
jgi:hypothetical protein